MLQGVAWLLGATSVRVVAWYSSVSMGVGVVCLLCAWEVKEEEEVSP